MAHGSLSIALEVLKNGKTLADLKNYSVFSKTSLAACTKVAQDLNHLPLAGEEKEIIVKLQDLGAVEDFVRQYSTEVEKRQGHTKIWKKVYKFTQFVGPVLEVFKQANFTPECSIALGLIGLLLVQPFNNKSEIEDRLETEIGQLSDIISQVKFSRNAVPTVELNEQVEGLSGAIIDFLFQALHYQKKPGILKVLEGIVSGFARRFQNLVDKIRSHAAKIEQLAQREYTTILLGNKNTIDLTAKAVHELHARMVEQTAAFDIKIARIEQRMSNVQNSLTGHLQCEAVKYISELSAIFSISLDGIEHQTTLLKQQQQKGLAPRERWENNALDIDFPSWAKRNPRPILWIGGQQNNRGVSWVSSFAIDLVDALSTERDIDTAFVLCSNGDAEDTIKPLTIIKQIIIQLLMAHLDIVASPENVKVLSIQRFERAENSPQAAFILLSSILRMLEDADVHRNREIFLVIDRIDICLTPETDDVRKAFLNTLKLLNIEFKSLRVILTSQKPAQSMKLLLGGKEHVTEVWIDTTYRLYTTEQLSVFDRQL